MFPLGSWLLALSSVAIDPAHCRQVATGRTGSAIWETDGKGNLSISMDAKSAGEVSLRCRIPLPAGTNSVSLGFAHVYISFQPAAAKTSGSGLALAVGNCRGSLLRVAGEDWIEANNRVWSIEYPAGSRSADVVITLLDNSDQVPVRIDLSGLRLTPGRVNDVDVCQAVDDKLDGNRSQNHAHEAH